MRFEEASRFDFFFFALATSRTFDKLLSFSWSSWKPEKKTSRKWMENFLVLWILNWQFTTELHSVQISLLQLFLFISFRTTCGSNGIFSRRLDFSLYNVLPKQRINSIEVKVIMQKILIYSPARKFLKLQIIAIMLKMFAKTFLKVSHFLTAGETFMVELFSFIKLRHLRRRFKNHIFSPFSERSSARFVWWNCPKAMFSEMDQLTRKTRLTRAE